MSIADDLRASLCAGCIRYEQPRTEYCDRCGNDEFVGPVAELEAIVRELGEQPWHQGAGGSEVSNTDRGVRRMNEPAKWPSMKVALEMQTPMIGAFWAMRATRGEGPDGVAAHAPASVDVLRSRCLIPGHYSVLEFCWFCFYVSGISRICSHELVRHRHLSFAQESTRVAKAREHITMPPDCWAQEHERYDFGGYAATSMLIAGNGRAWVEMVQKRLCERAAPEIRRLAWEIRELLPPLLQEIAGPQCEKCSEESCNFNSR